MLRVAATGLTLLLVAAACGSTGTEADSTGGRGRDRQPATSRADARPTRDIIGEDARVLRVEDGDSIVVDLGGEQRVRLIGINTPERGECLGDAARVALREMIEGEIVTLEADLEPTDQFGRWLRYVWLDGELINAAMAEAGLAIARAYVPNTSRQADLDDAEEAARRSGIGMWDATACGTPVGTDVIITEISENPDGRDEDNLNGEYVVIANRGADLDLSGYVLRDGSSVNRFLFPDGFVLSRDAEVTVHVGCGADTTHHLYWCSDTPVWDNTGDQALLVNPSGAFVTTLEY